MLRDPVNVAVTPVASVCGKILQQVLFVARENKRALLTDVLRGSTVLRALVFTRTKHQANRIADQLDSHGISADAIHSNKSQNARQRALDDFDRGRIRVLVATDIVARGIDVPGISHVINYELPNDPESYVHRIGRTARAGADGIALSFCDREEVGLLRGIEKLTKCPVETLTEHPFHCAATAGLHQAGTAPRMPARPERGRRNFTSRPGHRRQRTSGR
jgi:ATP-dependent RNA helicase RhlE